MVREICSGEEMRHHMGRVPGLKDIWRPETVGELHHVLKAVAWMCTALPGLATKEVRLRELLENCL